MGTLNSSRFFVCVLAVAACAKPAEPEPLAAPAPALVREPRFAPLAGEWVRDVTDEAGAAGVMTLPLGSREPKPLVVGVHGAMSRPDWMCGAVRGAFGPDTFVVCPHPTSRIREVSSWSSGPQLAAAVRRAIDAALVAYGDRIDRSLIVYFGHSQGSMTLPAAYATQRPELPFVGVVLFEGMPKDTSLLEPALRNMGARHVLLVNGQGGWQAKHAAVARSLSTHGFHAWHVPGTFGHFFNDAALALLVRETPALFERDAHAPGEESSKKRIASVTIPRVLR